MTALSGLLDAALDFTQPRTAAVRRALAAANDHAAHADLLFLEHWEFAPVPGSAAALRVSQIRRANPELTAAIRAELAAAQAPRQSGRMADRVVVERKPAC